MSSNEDHARMKSPDEEGLQIKTSDEDYFPDKTLLDRPRRSKRKLQSEIRRLRSSSAKEKAAEKEQAQKKRKVSKKGVKQKKNNTVEDEECVFSGEPLTPAELHQLRIKFEKDGHFRCESKNTSPTNVKNVETPINAKNKKEKACKESFIDGIISQEKTDPLLVTVRNPLPNASGSTLRISANKNEYVPSAPLDYYKNWNFSRIPQHFSSANNLQVGRDLAPDRSAFTILPSTQHNTQMLSNGHYKTFNPINSSGYYYKRTSEFGYSNSLPSFQGKQSNLENIPNSCGNFTILPPENHNVYDPFNQSKNIPSSFQGRQMPLENVSTLQNHNPYEHPLNNWQELNALNTFATGNAPTRNVLDPQNCMTYIPYTNYASGGNATISTKQSEYYSSLGNWNNLPAYENSHVNKSELSLVNGTTNYSMSHNSPPCSQYVMESSNFIPQLPYQPPNKYNNRDEFTDDKENTEIVDVTSSVVAKSSTIDEWVKNSQPDKNFQILGLNDLPDDDDYLCATVSSICSYDDDVTYNNRMNNLAYKDNSFSTTTTLNDEFTGNTLTKMKSPPVYGESIKNSSSNNDVIQDHDISTLYNFNSKTGLVDSSNYVLLENETNV